MSTGRRRLGTGLSLLALVLLFGGQGLAAEAKPKPKVPQKAAAPAQVAAPPEPLTPGFNVKPSEVALPQDVPLGEYRRTIRPFPNWTLICDENLVKKQRVCNISQTIVDDQGATVFSWSLAARQDGQPLFIMRTPPAVGGNTEIKLDPRDGQPPIATTIQGCTAQVCIAYQPVGDRLRNAVKKGGVVEVIYVGGSPSAATAFRAPLAGLATALAAI